MCLLTVVVLLFVVLFEMPIVRIAVRCLYTVGTDERRQTEYHNEGGNQKATKDELRGECDSNQQDNDRNNEL